MQRKVKVVYISAHNLVLQVTTILIIEEGKITQIGLMALIKGTHI